MASPPQVLLSSRLARDADAGVREIGRRCMAAYDEHAGMKYARLTSTDEAHMTAAVAAAKASRDAIRAAMLEEGLGMITVGREAAVPRRT
ncbi:MAG TPA: hypothetical protein VMH39_03645 [Gemmatimonadaceae bacterium]|nr:hypothetical protein [Gemmatimonadaceae bacterium]